MSRLRWLLPPAVVVLILAGGFLTWRFFAEPERAEVVAYVSADQELAEPILRLFEHRTGVRVLAVYDTEANKTAGLAMRLSQERTRPRCDVFWASEPLRMARLSREGILEDYDSPEAEGLPRFKGWTAFSSRARVILVNTRLVPLEADHPGTLQDLTSPRWMGRVAVSDPRFGTSSTHAAALDASWGREGLLSYARGLKANGARLCAGAAMVRELVERGELAVGVLDSDDAWVALDRKMPVAVIIPNPSTLVFPNAAALIKGGPHPQAGRLLMDFLLSPEVEGLLAGPPVRQPPLRPSVPFPGEIVRPKAMPADWEALGASVEEAAQAFYDALRP